MQKDDFWKRNRFKDRQIMPPEGGYKGKLAHLVRIEPDNPERYLFLFEFKHQRKKYLAGMVLDSIVKPGNRSFELAACLLGKRPYLGESVKVSEMMGKVCLIDVKRAYNEEVGWYLKISSFMHYSGW